MLERLKELGPDVVMAWIGWTMHGLIHQAGHWMKVALRKARRVR